ncbi:MAG: hypothetical protein DHS20C16_36880 [Phycisphaerae bacterium]|nr:MAG: hypothetical protein DHS20C16_36880 [Phycisphaerae bacterium]
MFPFQALVKRELLTSLRRIRIMVALTLLVVCSIGVVWISWPETSSSPAMVSNQMTEILGGLSIVLLGGCVLFIPSVAAGAIVAEREQDTLELLRMSLVRGSGIVFAKLINAIGIFTLLIIAVAPAIGTTLFGVGLEITVILQVFVVLATVALTCALAGLASSAFFRKTIWAVIGAYAFTVVAFLSPVVFALVLTGLEFAGYLTPFYNSLSNGTYGPVRTEFLNIVSYGNLPALVSPVSAIILIFDGNWSGWWILVSVFIQVPFWLAFGMLTMRWLRNRDPHGVIDNEKPIDDLDILRARREQFPYYLIDPLKRKAPIEDSRNPMFVREVRWGLFSRMTTLMRLCLAVFAMFFIGALFPVLYDSHESDAIIISQWAAVQYFVTMLFAPALVANSFTKELEMGNMDMIRMTLMHPRQILIGKAGAGFIVLSPVIIAVLVASIPLLFIGVRALPELSASVLTGLVWAAFCVAVSLTASLFAKRTLGALITSYGIVAFTYLVLNMFIDFLRDRFRYGRVSYNQRYYRNDLEEVNLDWLDALRLLNPTSAALESRTDQLWFLNTAVALTIIATCYGVSAFVLSRYRMQDR